MNPLSVSVVIPTYNRAHLIGRAVRSVLAAFEPGDEVIVVDDGSTDGTAEALRPFGDRIRCVRGPHRGCGAARNTGIAAARNPLLAFNDSDDEWMPDKLALQRALLRARPELVFCFSDFGLRAADGECPGGLFGWHGDHRSWDEILGPGVRFSTLADLPPGRDDFHVHIGDLYHAMLGTNYVAAQSVLVQRTLAGDALRFAEDLHIHEDHECFSRLARVGPAAYMDCMTFWQWGHDGPRLSGADDLRSSTDRITLLERVWGDDAEFQARHGDRYHQTLAAARVKRARALLRDGQFAAARAELRRTTRGPRVMRLLAGLPAPLVQLAVLLRRVFHIVLAALLLSSDAIGDWETVVA